MKYSIKNKEITLNINAANYGKFRFKERQDNIAFGESFSARQSNFNNDVYLEWQIGYDAIVTDVNNGKKNTKLNKIFFIGANGKNKYPYELSELLFEAIKIELIPKNKVKTLLDDIKKYDNFIDERKIKMTETKEIQINSINFKETSISLPALFMIETEDGTQIEIHIKQQQYAAGTQPMVYFCIPFRCFDNHHKFIGKSSLPGENLEYIINDKNVSILFDLFKIFAMCSSSHNSDVSEILKTLIKQIS